MGGIKYFESKSEDGGLISIDDSYNVMQLIKTISGNARYVYENNENVYYVDVDDNGELVWGYGLDELDGFGAVGFQIERANTKSLRVRLILNKKGYDDNDHWSDRNDALLNKLKFMGFKSVYKQPKSTSLAGMEVYDKEGYALFSTAKKTLKIIYMCDSKSLHVEEPSEYQIKLFENSPTITYRKKGVFIPTGNLADIQRSVSSWISVNCANVTNKQTKIYSANISCTSRHRRPTAYENLHYNTRGAIIGEI